MFVSWVATSGTGSSTPWQAPDPDPEPEGRGLVWRETGANYWSGSSGSQPRGTAISSCE
jgi:hypothetical protein